MPRPNRFVPTFATRLLDSLRARGRVAPPPAPEPLRPGPIITFPPPRSCYYENFRVGQLTEGGTSDRLEVWNWGTRSSVMTGGTTQAEQRDREARARRESEIVDQIERLSRRLALAEETGQWTNIWHDLGGAPLQVHGPGVIPNLLAEPAEVT